MIEQYEEEYIPNEEEVLLQYLKGEKKTPQQIEDSLTQGDDDDFKSTRMN